MEAPLWETASSTSSVEISSDWYSDILSQSVKNEFKNTAEAIKASYDNNSFRYIMITDTHIDTTQSQDNYELVLNTIDYAKRIAANCGIDAIVLGGDFITGWRDKQSALIGLKAIGDAVGRSKFDYVTEDSDGADNRQGLDNSDSTRYLFDIFSVNTEKLNRIRFGNGVDKTIFSKAE